MGIDEATLNQFVTQFRPFSERAESQKREEFNLGATVWDFFLRMDAELKELIQSLGSTNGTTDFEKYTKRHTEIVAYMIQLGKVDLLDSSGLSVSDIERYETLQHKYVKKEPLMRKIEAEESRLQMLKARRELVNPFLINYKAALYADKDLAPSNVHKRLEDSVLIHQAHSEFIERFGSEREAEHAHSDQVRALLPDSNDKVTGLDIMVKRYMVGVFYLGALNALIEQVDSNVAGMQKESGRYNLTPGEIDDLHRFKRGLHPTYNAGNYFNNYYRTLFANILKFFKELGVKPSL